MNEFNCKTHNQIKYVIQFELAIEKNIYFNVEIDNNSWIISYGFIH